MWEGADAVDETQRQLDQYKAKLTAMHRRAQAAESELAKLRKQPTNTWSSRERIIEAQERDAMMAAIELVTNQSGRGLYCTRHPNNSLPCETCREERRLEELNE